MSTDEGKIKKKVKKNIFKNKQMMVLHTSLNMT